MANVLELDPRTLHPNPFNSNRVSPENMAKLKRSIETLGFASAVVVREVDGQYQILGGKHRVEAAIELGLKTVPVVNLGVISEVHARKVGLVDNHRFGNDEVIALAKIFEEIGEGSEMLSEILPISQADIDAVIGVTEIDLDSFDIEIDDDDEKPGSEERRERPLKTHEILKFRMTLPDAERVRQAVERTIKREGLKDGDDLTNAGQALALLLSEDE